MASVIIPLEIPESEIARVKKAAAEYTGLSESASGKELLRAVVKRALTETEERRQLAEVKSPTPPSIT